MKLTDRQKQYIWLMGSFPKYVAEQGRGYRTEKLMYGLDDDNERLYIFGYSTPFLWLTNRGLVRRLQNDTRGYVLTDEGEAQFTRLLAAGAGMNLNRQIRLVQLTAINQEVFP